MKIIALNRKAHRDYYIEEQYEAGIELAGTEVKSLRQGAASLGDGYAAVDRGEVFLYNVHINPYDKGGIFNKDPKRPRKLLLRKDEIKRIYGKTRQRGYTLVPLKLYFNPRGLAKVELGLAKGKKLYDKREVIKRREMAREKAALRKYRGR